MMDVAMNNTRVTQPSDRDRAVFADLDPEVLAELRGKAVAVDCETRKILESAATVAELRNLMELRHPNISYRALPVGDLSRVTVDEVTNA